MLARRTSKCRMRAPDGSIGSLAPSLCKGVLSLWTFSLWIYTSAYKRTMWCDGELPFAFRCFLQPALVQERSHVGRGVGVVALQAAGLQQCARVDVAAPQRRRQELRGKVESDQQEYSLLTNRSLHRRPQ